MGMMDEGRWNAPLYGKKGKKNNQPTVKPKQDKGNPKNPKKDER